jgi:hypothetical protein
MFLKLYIIGGLIAAAAMALNLISAKPYTEINLNAQSIIKKAVCGGYAIGLFLIAIGIKDFGDMWWLNAISFLLGLTAFGALLEFFKRFPLAPENFNL